MNTEGLSSPRTRCRSASFQTPFHSSLLFPRVQEPAAIRLRHPVFQTPFLCSVMPKFAIMREQSQACLSLSYCHAELVSASHREPFLVLLRGQILKFAIKREQSQACLNYAEPTNETRAEDACILCLVRRRKTKST